MASSENDVSPDFFNIDSLLARSARVACTYNSSTPAEVFELLGTTAPHFTDEKGYRVLTPFWFVPALAPFCSLTLPRAYTANVRDVLLANAAHANLDVLQPYYYEMGMCICHLVSADTAYEIANCLLETIIQRLGDVVLKTIYDSGSPSIIDNTEKKLYQESTKCRIRLHEYFSMHQTTRSRRRRN